MSNTSTPVKNKVKQSTMKDFAFKGIGNLTRMRKTPSLPKVSPIEKEDGAGALIDPPSIGGVKHTSSGKLSHFPGRESLVTMNSRLEDAVSDEESPKLSPPRKRRSSTTDEEDIFDEIAKNVVSDSEASPRPLQVYPDNLLSERRDMTKMGEKRAIASALAVIGQHAALESDEEFVWDHEGDLDRSLYEDSNHPLPIQEEGEGESEDEDEQMSTTPVNESESPSPLLGMRDLFTAMSKDLGNQLESMSNQFQSMLSIAEKKIFDSVAEQGQKMTQQYEEIKVFVSRFNEFENRVNQRLGKIDDLNVETRIGDLELQFSQLLAKDKLKDDQIKALKGTVSELQDKVASLAVRGVAGGGESAALTAGRAEGDETFTDTELKALKKVIVKHHRDENLYWNRSIMVSNLGPLAKGASYNEVFELLRKRGLDDLIKSCDSFFIHASGTVRFSFKSFVDKNQIVSRSRRILKENKNTSISIQSVLSPEHLGRKKELVSLGNSLKASKQIIRYSVEMFRGEAMLRCVLPNGKIDWMKTNLEKGGSVEMDVEHE